MPAQAKKATTLQPAAQPATATVAAWALTGSQPAKLYRPKTARYLWWAAVQAALASGPVAAATLYKAHVASPPSTPTRGKLAGVCEPPAGWYGYLARQGLVKATTVKVVQQ